MKQPDQKEVAEGGDGQLQARRGIIRVGYASGRTEQAFTHEI